MSILKNKYFLLLLSASGILTAILYWDTFVNLVNIWDSKEEYSHGYMIPLVSLYFIWQKKELILAERFNPSWVGIVVSLFAMGIYFIGTVGDIYFLLRFSFIFLLIGIALSACGYKVTRLILIPILLIAFSFPIPPVLQAGLTAKLQLISSQLGVAFIRVCEIPVFLEGNVIDLGNYQLQVVEACSGLRYLFPLMSLAFICAYMYQVVFWKRAIVFLTSIPVTILMNSFRIGVIGVLVENWGTSMAEGFIHDFEGWIVFMACFVVLFVEMWLLSWHERKEKGWESVFGLIIYAPATSAGRTSKVNFLPLIGVLIIILSTIIIIKPLGDRDDLIPERQEFSGFPMQLSDWTGVTDTLDQQTIDFLGLSDYILINFHKDKQWINFYVAYYEAQKHGVVPHSPKQCIPGGGWVISDIQETEFDGVEFNRAVITKGKTKQLVYYWYRQRGKDIANEYLLKWHTFVGSFQQRRTDGALIRLTTTINPDETAQVADERLQQFMQVMDDQLVMYVPN